MLLLTVSALLLLPPVQTWLASYATDYLKTEFNIEAKIGRLAITLPNKVEISDLYIEDDHNDTLIYAKEFFFAFSGFDTQKNMLKSSSVRLLDGRFYMRKYPQDSLFNFAYFLEKLNTGPSDSTAPDFRMRLSSVHIVGLDFIKHRLGCTDTCTNIFADDAEVNLTDFYLDGSYVTTQVNQISFIDTNRFSLHELQAKVAFQATYISLDDLHIKTDGTEINGSAKMKYDSFSDFNNFLEKVVLEGKFKESTILSNEFRSYIPEFPQFDDFYVNAKFEGPVNNLKLTDCTLRLGEETRFVGDIAIKDPTESTKLSIKANILTLATSPAEFKKYIYQFTGEMEWLEFFEPYELIEYKGKYAGTLADFDVNGTVKLDSTTVVVDAKLNGFDNMNTATYNGKISSERINLEKLLANETLGKVGLNLNVSGKGLSAETLDATLDGQISYIDILDYRYQNITLKGDVQGGKFDGKVLMNDPNIKLDFAGALNYLADTIQADFDANITDANLTALGFSTAPKSILSLKSTINYNILGDENWGGEIEFTDITYSSSEAFYFFDTVKVISTNVNHLHSDKLISKLITAELYGEYDIAEVGDAFYLEILNFSQLKTKREGRPQSNFEYSVFINNADILTNLFLPELHVEPGTQIDGYYRGPQNDFKLDLTSNQIAWERMRFNNVLLTAVHNDSTFFARNKTSSVVIGNNVIDSVNVAVDLRTDSANFKIDAIYRDSIDTYVKLEGIVNNFTDFNDKFFAVSFTDGRFNIGNTYFDVVKNNRIDFRNGDLVFDNVGFFNEKSSILMNGFYSENPNQILRLNANKLDASILNYLIRKKSLQLHGTINGDIIMNRYNGLPKFASTVSVDSLVINQSYLGDLSVNSNWNSKTSIVNFDAKLNRKALAMLSAVGTYMPDTTGAVDVAVEFDRLRLNWVDPFVEGILENVRGTVSGKMNITGSLDKMKTKGTLTLNQVALGVPFLGTDYGFEGQVPVQVENGKISIASAVINDTKEQTKGNITLEVSHKNFSDITMDLKITTDNLLALDAKNSPDAYFYGKGYVAGSVAMSGPLEELTMDIKITTNKGTDFKIPMSNPENVSSQSFITYTGNANRETIIIDLDNLDTKRNVKTGGLSILVDVNITPDANIELVMDETVGDIIRGRGKGNLRMAIPSDGDMTMYGTVEITSGDYLFTMRNLINKKFTVIPGGTIAWSGSPSDAEVDLKALYTTRTTLTGMVTSPDYQGQRVQVDLTMHLKGYILNPNISFDITLPGSNPSYAEELKNRLSDPDKLNYQAFSLLLINSFWVDGVGTENNNIAQGGVSNGAQMAFSQVSNFLAQGFGNYIDINIGYNTATGTELSDEFEVDISKNFLDDRLTVNSKIDVPVGGSSTSSSSQNFTGDVEVIYKITDDGRVRAKAFNRSNQDNPSLDKLSGYSQGVGIMYTTNFDTFSELMQTIFGIKPKEEEKQVEVKN